MVGADESTEIWRDPNIRLNHQKLTQMMKINFSDLFFSLHYLRQEDLPEEKTNKSKSREAVGKREG